MSVQPKFTPGPWAVREAWGSDDDFEVYPVRPGEPIEFGAWTEIATVSWVGQSDDEDAKATANLISAAPELYDAVRAIETARHSDDPKDWQLATDLSDAALAKAEGRQP